MNNFVFQNPTKLIFGKGMIAQLSTEIPTTKKILVTFGGGSVKKNGVYEQVKEALANHDVTEFWGIEPNPAVETLREAIDLGKRLKADFVLAVGGGSVIDGSKLIAAGIAYDGDAWDLVKNNALAKHTVDLGAVLTLPATGSEMNSGAVISNLEKQEKLVFGSPTSFPKFSILDPQVTYSLPKFQLGCGIVDTFVHIMEQYMTFPSNSMVMDRWAEGLLQTLVTLAPRIMEDQTNYDVMSNFMLTATMALNGFIAMGTPQDWATHMIGHELTAFKGITHGVSLAIVYPSMLQVMINDKMDKLVQYAERVWGITDGTPEEKAKAAIKKTEQFFRSVNIPTKLSEVDVYEDTVKDIVFRFKERNIKLGEKQNIDYTVIERILLKSL
ncbi:MAG TPA: alcohol dehydrogenase [Porphyromonadaceae bacterium]|nr:alcohol dehydrogenase [Porphyromonadaceae bacterium]